MAKRVIFECDICGAAGAEQKVETLVRFSTKETEDRLLTTSPYIETRELWLCDDHYRHFIRLLPVAGRHAGNGTEVYSLQRGGQ